MTIKGEIQSLSPSALVEMFVLDMSMFAGGGLSYFHAGTNGLQQPVVWQGRTYTPLPIEAEGFDLSARGQLPKPVVRVANINGLFSAAVAQNDDLIGAKITRKRTFAKYLDASNFPSGNPYADQNQHLPDEIWYVDRKVSENRYIIEWELASAFDVQGVMLPFRQVIQNACSWRYRSAECGYTGGYYDKNDVATSDVSQDYCSKRLSSCEARFGTNSYLPFGGFPGANRLGE